MRLHLLKTILVILMIAFLINACSQSETKEEGPKSEKFNFDSLVKSDIGLVLEVHVHESRALLRELMLKLYKRNPRELKKSIYSSAEENIDRLIEQMHGWNFPELEGKMGPAAIQLTFSDDYRGDRVFAFMAGLSSMIMSSYGYKTEFYMFDSADPQFIYNSARNIEISVWKLSHNYDKNGELYLYSNSLSDEVANLSYERIFGKLIALQDTMAIILAGKKAGP